MEITYYGANCFKLVTKNTNLVVDDNLSALGLKQVTGGDEVALFSQRILMGADEPDARVVIDGPGEFELGDITVQGIQARAYTDTEDQKTATIYKVMNGEYQVLFLGHVQAKLDTKVLEKIGVVDVLIVPVGGSGYTLDAEDASEVVKLINPKVVVPCHYKDDAIKYDMPMRELDDFKVKMGMGSVEALKSLKLKGELEESVVILERQK